MDKCSTSGRDAQAQRMAMKRQSARMLTEAMVGAGLSKWEAEALVASVEEVYFSDPELTPVLDGQLRYSCVRADEGPGKPLSACRKVSVTLTVLHREDKQDVSGLGAGGMSAEILQCEPGCARRRTIPVHCRRSHAQRNASRPGGAPSALRRPAGRWDGLKGYLTNTDRPPQAVIENYGPLWQVEKAFRISKTDLRIRPMHHRRRRRIEAHVLVAFVAYTIYKELERRLHLAKVAISPQCAAELTQTMYELTFRLPNDPQERRTLLQMDEEQQRLYDLFT
ncbi:MAG TPA: transposase [Candidatus Hydrogenedentes bacterium]|nr:transposase [Candidatus Hydrogenedentota bacterium]HRT20371.1 transposase [Candidatus Hydrogenedentota bacterium]HRT66569.1 transposase [Candidatus Hydrogenedentota bacterium]